MPNDKREGSKDDQLVEGKLLTDPKFVRAVCMVVVKARPQDPALHAALRVCRHLVTGVRGIVTSQLGDVLLSSLANPHALVHWPLLGDVSVSFFPLRSA